MIDACEQKTTATGKTYKKLELTDGMGKVVEASAWLNLETKEWFDSLKVGEEVSGDIKVKGQYTNLYPPYDPSKKRGNAPISRASVKDDVSASHMISDAMTRKEASIKKFVDKKEQGMIYFASLREAGNYMTVMSPRLTNIYKDSTVAEFEEDYHTEFWKQQRRFYKEIVEDAQR